MADNVYTGFWTNWEDGKVRGATLTLPLYRGLVLVSFLTLFTQLSGACFWRVICFILHQSRSTTMARDGLFHQQQSILRNATTAPNALWSLLRSGIAWRSKVNSPFRNSLPLMTITIVHLSFFAVAGLLSSRVTSTIAGQSLVRSVKCGIPTEFDNLRAVDPIKLKDEELLIFNTEAVLGRLSIAKGAAYVRSCYSENANAASAGCKLFVRSHLIGIDSSAVNNASCPFGSNACATPAVRYDSGTLHSNEDLGINFPESDSLSFRRVTTCAPILGEKYATEWKDGVLESLTNVSKTSAKFYEFGKDGEEHNGCEATTNTTDTTTFCVTKYLQDNTRTAYTVRANTAYYNSSISSDFVPIADFNIPDADVTLISILNKARYVAKNEDPVFNATNQSTGNTGYYTASQDLGILGCTEQYRVCNLGNARCTGLTGLYGIKQTVEKGSLSLTSRQQAVYQVMWRSAWSMGLQWALEVLSDDVLRARDSVFSVKSTTSSSLPSNQWEIEAFNLHNLSLAVFQRRINEFASPENLDIRPNVTSWDRIVRPTDPALLELCDQQKIRTSNYYSFSVLGMGLILGVGSLLILLDWIIIQQIFWFRSLASGRHNRKLDWTETGTLQLQRQVLDARGVGPWSTRDYEFPVLVERCRTFVGLGAQADMAIPLDQMHGAHLGYGLDHESSYKGGGYKVVPGERLNSDDKIHI